MNDIRATSEVLKTLKVSYAYAIRQKKSSHTPARAFMMYAPAI